MSFLPIVQRELRAAARRKSTFRIRSWTVILAIIVSFFALAFFLLTRGRGNLGNPLFTYLTRYAFGLCLLAGVFLTADSLSEEKREGTLGLLFLTDLHGYDVVLGKFVAMLVNALYGLLALLPIIAIPLLLGGVTGAEFWRTALALVNALFVSLAAGIFISAWARDAQHAMGAALGLILILVAALPALAALGSLGRLARPLSFLAWLSPYYSFSYAGAALYYAHAGKFWGTLAASHALGWAFLSLASAMLPHRWQEGVVAKPAVWVDRWLRHSRGSSETRIKVRRELLPINPILWLAGSEPGFARAAWAIVLIWAGLVGVVTLLAPRELGTLMLSWYGVRPFGFLLKALFAVQVCRLFAEARRNGALEMLLCTPLTNREIIGGQSLAMRRTFLWPVLVFTGLLFVSNAVQVISGLSSLNFQQLMTGGFGFIVSIITAVRTVADFLALFWFGLWLTLTMKKPNLAPALTILAVLILPSILCWLDVFADLFFILWGATKLQQDMRWVLSKQYRQAAIPTLRPILSPAPPGVPPIIAKP
jgi:ABC-type transport system involved in multi-copper enzyme maturation permease subunit